MLLSLAASGRHSGWSRSERANGIKRAFYSGVCPLFAEDSAFYLLSYLFLFPLVGCFLVHTSCNCVGPYSSSIPSCSTQLPWHFHRQGIKVEAVGCPSICISLGNGRFPSRTLCLRHVARRHLDAVLQTRAVLKPMCRKLMNCHQLKTGQCDLLPPENW